MEKHQLICGKEYGTRAKEIYLDCCRDFGWDAAQSSRFAQQQSLYGYRADGSRTKDVWFVCHNNLCSDKFVAGSDGEMHHRNFVYTDEMGRIVQIDEYQSNEPYPELVFPLRDRITFVKNKKGKYVFAGTFRCAQPASRKASRIFVKIGDNYTGR